MASSKVTSGALVLLEELNPSSSFFRHGASLRVTAKLQEYVVESAVAIIVDGTSTLRINTQHLSLNFRIGSIYQFIGELEVHPDNDEAILNARVGRNVDGMDLSLYRQSLQLLRDFEAEQTK